MVTEGAYGQLKGRWRILLRKCENSPEYLKTMTLACMVFHNVCLDLGDTISCKLDVVPQNPAFFDTLSPKVFHDCLANFLHDC